MLLFSHHAPPGTGRMCVLPSKPNEMGNKGNAKSVVSIFFFFFFLIRPVGFPCSSVSKESACSAEDSGSIPGLGRPPGEGHGNPL